jgi:hypothetical protein
MSKNVVSLFDNDDPRIDALVKDIHKVIDKRARGIFQLATVLGALRTIEYELIKEAENQ